MWCVAHCTVQQLALQCCTWSAFRCLYYLAEHPRRLQVVQAREAVRKLNLLGRMATSWAVRCCADRPTDGLRCLHCCADLTGAALRGHRCRHEVRRECEARVAHWAALLEEVVSWCC